MKTYKKISYAIVAILIATSAALAASSSSSSVATSSSNGGTSIAISNSEATGNGVAVSNSNADASKGGIAISESSSKAKDNEMIVSNSNAASSSPNNIVRTTTVNGVTTSTSSQNTNTNNFFIIASDEINNLPFGIQTIVVNGTSQMYNENININGTPIQVLNFSNLTSFSDVLVTSNTTLNMQTINETISSPNITYNIIMKNSSNQVSLIQMLLNLLHL